MQSSKLFVGNLRYSITNEQLYELFSNYGRVVNVNVIPGKGFAFVEYASPAEAQMAADYLDGTDYDGRLLRVNEAKPKESKGSRHDNPPRRF